MSNHIRDLKYQAELANAQRQSADTEIVELIQYLNSDKFQCGSELDGYVNVKDIMDRLRNVRACLYKDGDEFGIEADPDIRFKQVNVRQDILVEYEIMYHDGFSLDMIGRVGQIVNDEGSEYYDAKVGCHIVEFFSAPGVSGEVSRWNTKTAAKENARSKAVEFARQLIEAGQLNK